MNIRFGIIGTNWITERFIQAAREAEGFELTAVYSRTKRKRMPSRLNMALPYLYRFGSYGMQRGAGCSVYRIANLISCDSCYPLHELWEACALRETGCIELERAAANDRCS